MSPEQLASFGRTLLKIGGAVAVTYGLMPQADADCINRAITQLTMPQNLMALSGAISTLAGIGMSWKSHLPARSRSGEGR